MPALTVRRLLVDLDTAPERHWNGGDSFRTALFNALSFSFPAGEQFFIDAVRLGLADLDADARQRFDAAQRAFIGQEATHRRIHQRFNAHLHARGLVNHWEGRIVRRQRRLHGLDSRAWVGLTAATEHFTAFLAAYLFSRPQALAGCEPRLHDLWLWHASEELEHRSVAFDLYRALDGNERWRRRLFWIVTVHFIVDLTRQTLNNLWHDGTWWRPGTWASAWKTVLGPGGLLRECFGPWRSYLQPGFHPDAGDASAGERWLAAHAALAPPVAADQKLATSPP